MIWRFTRCWRGSGRGGCGRRICHTGMLGYSIRHITSFCRIRAMLSPTIYSESSRRVARPGSASRVRIRSTFRSGDSRPEPTKPIGNTFADRDRLRLIAFFKRLNKLSVYLIRSGHDAPRNHGNEKHQRNQPHKGVHVRIPFWWGPCVPTSRTQRIPPV